MDGVRQGLRENWRQFALLVAINAFVGGMVGLERAIFPAFAVLRFGIASKTAVLSFIVAFGLAKAIANYYTGRLANRLGRKNLLLLGWLAALPVPVIFIYTHQWAWIVFANALLGVSQGLAWSSTVVMKIDLVGEKDRGLAMGLNEFAGYLAMGAVAFLTGYVAHRYGVWPYPFYIGVAIAAAGLLLSWGWVRDTSSFVARERLAQAADPLQNVFMETSFRNKTLSAVTQAGLVNNLNDGMIWGLLPMALATLGHETKSIGVIAAIYPAVWGIGQLFTGKMADIYPRKAMLFWGMLAQGLAILLMPGASAFGEWAALATALGLGTALVYPTFLTVIATVASPGQRAESIGVFRLWRDLGYALGAIVSGITADLLGLNYAIWLTGAITLFSAGVVQWRMPGPGPLHKRK